MRILLVTETLIVGGAETFVVRLANWLADKHEITLAVMHGELVQPELKARLSARVRYEALVLPGKKWLFKIDSALRKAKLDLSPLYWLQRRWLTNVVGRLKPDIVHSHLLKADRLASMICQGTSCRHVITLHGDYRPYIESQADPHFLKLTERLHGVVDQAAALVGVCSEHLEFVAKIAPQARPRLHMIYNGYSALASEDADSDNTLALPAGFLFGMVSRGVEKKGWQEAIDAFVSLGAANAWLVLVGSGPYLDHLAAGPLPSNVILAGFSADPVKYIRHFDVCLLPTLFPYESLPTVVIEYLACAKPVVATDVGEIAVMLADGSGGSAGRLLAFDGENISHEQLVGEMRRLFEDASLRHQLSQSAVAAFAKFDMTRCGEAYLSVYRDAVAES